MDSCNISACDLLMRVIYWHPLFGWPSDTDNFYKHKYSLLSLGLGRGGLNHNTSNKAMKKSSTFLPQRSNSMEFPNFPRSTSLVLNKSPSVEYPSSVNPTQGEPMLLSCHPHPLAQVTSPEPFICMGCKEYGAGTRFTCQQCNNQLHEFCALAPTTLKSHPLHRLHPLEFCSKPVKGGILGTKCDICSKPTAGYTFRCSACSFQIHPCCAMLSTEMTFVVHPHPLTLMPAMALSSGDPGFSCGECKRKRSGRVFHCTAPSCDYHLHAVCAKNMVNGLRASGIMSLEKPSMLGTAAKIASQVVIEFIGGLIEGLGQGVGDVLVQTIARGRCTTRRRLE
ncbi:hypothetical protein VitviT2T_026850 [Vitis vinifera]|uniref:DC1 domain-containing protein n=1 Tax=Vitis vinifera TaxID=29760 RepID=A0ABY9DP56_VITVI|nr:protein VACUOLELESS GAMETOPHYTES [Vitis vinifera]WKA09177.1 hypothetical protein VitviT2T_026850 [Vitis vinifera]|eukprot:XP_002273882.2 PREDICTED: uncharacterized protein LOC100252968 isoform X1 [Vitis vinifera]